ncbi:DUF2156 domain-containing protein [Glaciibacter flavus]|uniref:DUF2156 domain-containing protein n=1 Tax=Orlajensenia flava TaxID=2565934 RepID=A0A4S4FWP9_9MICO|nr:DUF2156 domain-containing protein [Glaciibacter flavus]THG34984.1 DUF2156 domain-containing protein [Glaciibacter flavus]
MRVLRQAARIPVALCVAGILLVIGIISMAGGGRGVLSPERAGADPAAIAQHHWWVLITSQLIAGSWPALIIAVVATIIVVGWAERTMGGARTVLAFVVTGTIASLVGLGLEYIGSRAGEYWTSSVSALDTLDPLTPIAGTLAWASAGANGIWRRRIRVLLLTGAVAMLLYSGLPSDLYLLVAVGVGLLGGRLTLGRSAIPHWRSSRRERRGLLALVTIVLALGPLLSLAAPVRFGLLAPLGVTMSDATPSGRMPRVGCGNGRFDLNCVNALGHAHLHGVGGTLLSILPLVLMLVGAWGLLAGRRAAVWMLAALGLVQSAVAAWYLGILPATTSAGPPPGRHNAELVVWVAASILVPFAFSLILLAERRSFPVRVARRRALVITGLLAGWALVCVAVALAGSWLLRDQFRPAATWAGLLADLPSRFVPSSFLRSQPLVLHPTSPLANVVVHGAGPLFWVGVIVATVLLLRGTGTAVVAPDAARIRSLLARGSGTLGYMATWAGNSLWTSSNASAGIAYRVVGGVAVTTSDPFGSPAHPGAVLREFVEFCDANAWTPVFYSVHEPVRATLAEAGWSSIEVAEEITVDPRGFSTSGKAMQDVRTSVNRSRRDDLRVRWATWSEMPVRITAQITALSEEWMSSKDLPELGFTLGGLDELRDDDVMLAVVLDTEDRVRAITSWLPIRRDGVLMGRTLDMMRRAPGAPNGVMEFVIAEAMSHFAAEGLVVVSLSGSPLAGAGAERAGAPLAQVLDLLARTLEPLYGFRSLLRFKKKFSPALEPLHLVYRDPVTLPAIGMAVARCYLPTLTVRGLGEILRDRQNR